MYKKAIVVVDVQNDFVSGALGSKEAREMIPRLVRKLEDTQHDVIFTMDTHNEKYLETQEGKFLPIPHCIKGTEGWQIVPELREYAALAELEEYAGRVRVIEKKSFGSTRLPSLLKPYDEIEFCGLCTDICVVSNALLIKAFYPETLISIDSKCCAGSSPEAHEAALLTMKNCHCKIN